MVSRNLIAPATAILLATFGVASAEEASPVDQAVVGIDAVSEGMDLPSEATAEAGSDETVPDAPVAVTATLPGEPLEEPVLAIDPPVEGVDFGPVDLSSPDQGDAEEGDTPDGETAPDAGTLPGETPEEPIVIIDPPVDFFTLGTVDPVPLDEGEAESGDPIDNPVVVIDPPIALETGGPVDVPMPDQSDAEGGGPTDDPIVVIDPPVVDDGTGPSDPVDMTGGEGSDRGTLPGTGEETTPPPDVAGPITVLPPPMPTALPDGVFVAPLGMAGGILPPVAPLALPTSAPTGTGPVAVTDPAPVEAAPPVVLTETGDSGEDHAVCEPANRVRSKALCP